MEKVLKKSEPFGEPLMVLQAAKSIKTFLRVWWFKNLFMVTFEYH